VKPFERRGERKDGGKKGDWNEKWMGWNERRRFETGDVTLYDITISTMHQHLAFWRVVKCQLLTPCVLETCQMSIAREKKIHFLHEIYAGVSLIP